MGAKEEKVKPKGTILTGLDVDVVGVDNEPIWRPKESVLGLPIVDRDDDGIPKKDAVVPQEKLTRRKAILLSLALEPEKEQQDQDAKLRAGYLQRIFWKDKQVEVDAEDITFIKNRLNYRWNGVIFSILCEFLEGVKAK